MKHFLWTSENYYKEKIKNLQMVVCIKKQKDTILTPFLTTGPAKSNGLMVILSFSYKRIGVTLYNGFKHHYTLAYMKDGKCLYYDGHLKPPHTQPLAAKIMKRSVTKHVLFVRQNK